MSARRVCGYTIGLIMAAGLYTNSYWVAGVFGFLFFIFCVDEIGGHK